MAGALEGIRVLDLSTLVQGPQAAAMLHDLGAEVIKVELPEIGDVGRHIGLVPGIEHSSVFIACNRGKRSITVDLRVPDGKAVLEKLVETADVLLSNFKPGTLEEWGLSYEHLAAINPRLIWAAGSFLGPAGPDASREGADMVGQAYGGSVASSGYDGLPVAPTGFLMADHCGSQNLQTGILAALFARERTGRGQRVDVSLLGGQVWAQATEFTHYMMTGEVVGRTNGGHPLVHALYGVFETGDGGALAIAGCPDHLWDAMVEATEHPELHDNPRFGTYLATPEIREELFEVFGAIFKERPVAEWEERLTKAGQRFAKVRTHAEVVADPQTAANNYVVDIPDTWGVSKVLGSPITMTDTPTRWGTEVAELGQHTEEILLEVGFGWDEIAALRDSGAI